ncbi:MAG: hypothetical protein ACRECH_15375 [Nitrososphaerales archaeon]
MLPDIKLIEDIFIEENKVWIRMKARGTNHGSMMAKPLTGKKMAIDVFQVFTFSENPPYGVELASP